MLLLQDKRGVECLQLKGEKWERKLCKHRLEHLNDTTAHWLRDVADVRLHRETRQRPIDRFHEEASHLIPLPAHAFDTAEVVYRCVTTEGRITYAQST